MPTLHLVNVADFLHIHADAQADGSISISFAMNKVKLKPVLDSIAYTDSIGWLLPVGSKPESVNRIACLQHRLLMSDAPGKKIAITEVDRLVLKAQLRNLFERFAPNQYLFEVIESSVGVAAYRIVVQASGEYDYLAITDEGELDGIVVEQVDSYGSSEDIFKEVLMCLPEISKRRMHRYAMEGEPRPADYAMYQQDLAAGTVENVFCDLDNTLLYSDWLLRTDAVLQKRCDVIHAALLEAGIDLIADYPSAGNSAERYAVLKLSALAAFELDHNNVNAINVLQNLYQLNTEELYGARLDKWFNVMHARFYDMNVAQATALSEHYRSTPLINREMECVQMLCRARRRNKSVIGPFAGEMLASLKETMQHLSVHRPTSKAVMDCLFDAHRLGVKHQLTTTRQRPDDGASADRGPLSLGSVVLNHSGRAFHKGGSSYVARLVDAVAYVPTGVDNNGHHSTKLLFHTISVLLSGEVYRQAKTRFLYLLDHDMRESHPLLVAQCNELLKRHRINLQWKTVAIYRGGENVNAALAHPEHAVSAGVDDVLCEHCMPARIYDLTKQRYQRLVAERVAATAASGAGAPAGVDSELLYQAYQHVWSELASPVVATAVAVDLRTHGVFADRTALEPASAVYSVDVAPLVVVDGRIDWSQFPEPDTAMPVDLHAGDDDALLALAAAALPSVVVDTQDAEKDAKQSVDEVSLIGTGAGR